jgi:predicted Fe-Mo cluster-binding NifX family protein
MHMRIAISIDDNSGLDAASSHHFGRCPYFVLVDITDEKVVGEKVVENPHYAEHRPGQVPGFIKSQDVDLMISGHMGRRAMEFFSDFGIQTATGAAGTARETLDRFLSGELSDAEACCDHGPHHQGHRCGDHQA